MIIFFGPAGAGKSMQGQMLAARHGWRWLSSGQIFRDQADHEMLDFLKTGELIPDSVTNKTIFSALDRAHTCGDVDRVILDGYPRIVPQAEALVKHEEERCGQNTISMCVVLEVPKSEIISRLSKRGRPDDEPEAVDRRLQLHRSEIYPILDYFNNLGVPIEHIDGVGTVGEVHDRIEAELLSHGIVKAN
jgi:adenylate kinase